MPGALELWLGTFMCKQYAGLFEAYGFKTLQSVCQLQASTVHSMGIPPEHCDKILENVSVLRQSFSEPVVSNFSEQSYDHQMTNHGQSNNSYSYHSPSSYPSPHQYGNPNGQINHAMPYSTGESYPAAQSMHYGTSNQDVYSQQMYNNHLHPNHGSWDDPMRLYNHTPRHVMGSSPPPASSLMRSPPPPSPSSGMSISSHYPHHVHLEQSSVSHHHAWSQSQVLSPTMVNSPRGTPSPGMGHPSSISSPVMAGCSPAHVKPFSPPPYSPHPPPAHQQSVGYDYPPSQNSSPLSSTASRHMPSPAAPMPSPSDPLQSLQKMVMLDPQAQRGIIRLPADDTGSMSPSKCGPKLGPLDQVTECATPSPCSSHLSQKSKRVASPEASSSESTDSSAISDKPHESPAAPPVCSKNTSGSVPDAAASSESETSDDSLDSDDVQSKTSNSSSKETSKDASDELLKTPEKMKPGAHGSETEVKKEVAKVLTNIQENGHETSNLPRASLLKPLTASLLSNSTSVTVTRVISPKTVYPLKKNEGKILECDAEDSLDGTLPSRKNVRKKQKAMRDRSGLTPKPLNHVTSKVNGEKLGKWNLELSPDVTFVARKVKGGESVIGSFEIVNKRENHKHDSTRLSAGIEEVKKLRNCSQGTPTSPRRSGRLQTAPVEPETTGHDKQSATPSPIKVEPAEAVNGEVAAKNGESGKPLNSSRTGPCSVATPCLPSSIKSEPTHCNSDSPRKRGRPLGSKNKPRLDDGVEPEAKKPKKKKLLKDEPESNSKKPKQLTVQADCTDVKKSAAETKPKGPFLHVEGTRERPLSVLVVNSLLKDDETEGKGLKRKELRSSERTSLRNKMMAVGFNSTLSANYDVFTKDKSWVCALCHRGSHYNGLGDLFGPYFEEGGNPAAELDTDGLEESGRKDDSPCPGSGRRVREKRKRSELVEEFFKTTMAKKGKRIQGSSKLRSPVVNPSNSATSQVDNRETKASSKSGSVTCASGTKELWVHENCIVWCHGVHLLQQRIVGIKEAIREASLMVCSSCSERGATVGCLHKGCREQFHYLCAIEKGCFIDAESFSLFCPKHKQGRVPST